VSKVKRVILVKKVLRVNLVPLAHKVCKVSKVLLAQKVNKAWMDYRVPLVSQALVAQMAQRVLLE
jgi:hypothetical protein